MIRAALLALVLLSPRLAAGCETALLLAADVSGSVDAGEYQLQAEGLARALRAPQIREILIADQVALSLIHWSGPDQQAVVIDWVVIRNAAMAELFAARAEGAPRHFAASGTALGAALQAAGAQFARAPSCRRRVLDLSGDGMSNEGPAVGPARRALIAAGIEINALAIEEIGDAISAYYRAQLISRGGFVQKVQGFSDFARAIRLKLLRELTRPAA